MHVSMPDARPPHDGPVELSWSEVLMVSRGVTRYLTQVAADAAAAPAAGRLIDLDERRRRRRAPDPQGGDRLDLAAPRAA